MVDGGVHGELPFAGSFANSDPPVSDDVGDPPAPGKSSSSDAPKCPAT